LSAWLWLIVILGGFALLYALSVGVLLAAGRREEGRALAGFIPDCVVLCARLVADPRLPRRYKLVLVALAGACEFTRPRPARRRIRRDQP